MIDFSIIQKANISAAEFAMLVRYKDSEGVARSTTRATVHRWIIGKHEPSTDMEVRIRKVLRLLQDAVAAGDLPLKLGTPRTERKNKIALAVGKHIKKVV